MVQNNFTPAQIIQMIRGGTNPQQLIMTMLDNQAQANPLYANLATLAKEGRTKEIEMIARNLAKEQGVDFDKELMNFRRQMGF
jgi:hypothetical protein